MISAEPEAALACYSGDVSFGAVSRRSAFQERNQKADLHLRSRQKVGSNLAVEALFVDIGSLRDRAAVYSMSGQKVEGTGPASFLL